MKVLIIGALGQDGKILSNLMVDAGHDVLGISSPGGQVSVEALSHRIISKDFSDFAVASEVLNGLKPNYIFHLGAVHGSAVNQKNLINTSLDSMRSTHVAITRNILDWQKQNISSRSLIALSSQMYTPNSSPSLVDETTPISPINGYGETKVEAWDLIKSARSEFGIHTSGAILFNHTSKYSKSEFLFPTLARKIIEVEKGKAVALSIQNTLVSLDITSAYDTCEAMSLIMKIESPEDFVIGSGKSIQLGLFLSGYIESRGLNCDVVSDSPDLVNKEKIPFLVSNIDKIQKYLGWKPKRNPAEILDEIINHLDNSKIENL